MYQQSSSSYDQNGSNGGGTSVPISHPYPPTYIAQHVDPTTTIPQPQGQQRGEYMMEYERRREERHAQNPPSSSSSNDPYSALSARPGIGRMRSPSESSTKEGQQGRLAIGYPDGWTKEDEDAEREFLSKGMINWNEMESWRFWIRKEWWFYYVLAIVIGVLVCLMSLYHDQIVDWMTPLANWMKNLPGGWAIPIGIFFVISFPPLFGHEILAILVGAVWGLWVGFGITAAGTFIGEVGNFYAFKYCLRSRAEKYEKTNLNYACMAHVVREGGFLIVFVARLSAIPGHFTTAVFSTCGMNIWIFMIACILTMPKQLIVVYLGVIFEDKDTSSKNKIISDSVLAVSFLVTLVAAWYIWKKMNEARVIVWRKRRMEAAARGLVLNDVPSQAGKRASYKEWAGVEGDPERGVMGMTEDDSRSPILHSDHRHQSYQNPYDIRYQPADNMSVYDVDGPNAREREQDISSGYNYITSVPAPMHDTTLHPYTYTSTDSRSTTPNPQFPEARSTGLGGVKRELSRATTSISYDDHDHERDGEVAEFPVPLPAPGNWTR